MATGSYPWIPPIKGAETQDCFVYRTIEDLNAIESCARRSKRGAVVGGGLLGLEAAGSAEKSRRGNPRDRVRADADGRAARPDGRRAAEA